jgi:uncharacterized protein YjbJ (UPF0337 family)
MTALTIRSQSKNKKMDRNGKKAPVKKAKGSAKTAGKTWAEQKLALKKQFPTLTDADMMFEESKKEEMFAKIQTKVGKTKEEMQKIIAAL